MKDNKLFMWFCNNDYLQIKSSIASIEHFSMNNNLNPGDRLLLICYDEDIDYLIDALNKIEIEIIGISKILSSLKLNNFEREFIKKNILIVWTIVPYMNFVIKRFKNLVVFDNDTLTNMDFEKLILTKTIMGKSIFEFGAFEEKFHNRSLRLIDKLQKSKPNVKNFSRINTYNKKYNLAFRQTMPISLMGFSDIESYNNYWSKKCNGGFWFIDVEKFAARFENNVSTYINEVSKLEHYYKNSNYRKWKISDEEVIAYFYYSEIQLVDNEFINFSSTNLSTLSKMEDEYLIHFAGYEGKKIWIKYLENGFIDTNSKEFKRILNNSKKLNHNPWAKILFNFPKRRNKFNIKNDKVFNK